MNVGYVHVCTYTYIEFYLQIPIIFFLPRYLNNIKLRLIIYGCLHSQLLPGQTLFLSPLLAQKKYRKKGNKDGAVRSFFQLENEGLGKTLEIGGTKGTTLVGAH